MPIAIIVPPESLDTIGTRHTSTSVGNVHRITVPASGILRVLAGTRRHCRGIPPTAVPGNPAQGLFKSAADERCYGRGCLHC